VISSVVLGAFAPHLAQANQAYNNSAAATAASACAVDPNWLTNPSLPAEVKKVAQMAAPISVTFISFLPKPFCI